MKRSPTLRCATCGAVLAQAEVGVTWRWLYDDRRGETRPVHTPCPEATDARAA